MGKALGEIGAQTKISTGFRASPANREERRIRGGHRVIAQPLLSHPGELLLFERFSLALPIAVGAAPAASMAPKVSGATSSHCAQFRKKAGAKSNALH
jgi:hypothetical protein